MSIRPQILTKQQVINQIVESDLFSILVEKTHKQILNNSDCDIELEFEMQILDYVKRMHQ
jgi:hypothetical protein